VKSATAIVSIEEFSPPLDITPESNRAGRSSISLCARTSACGALWLRAARCAISPTAIRLRNCGIGMSSRAGFEELSRARYRPACCLSIVVVDVLA